VCVCARTCARVCVHVTECENTTHEHNTGITSERGDTGLKVQMGGDRRGAVTSVDVIHADDVVSLLQKVHHVQCGGQARGVAQSWYSNTGIHEVCVYIYITVSSLTMIGQARGVAQSWYSNTGIHGI